MSSVLQKVIFYNWLDLVQLLSQCNFQRIHLLTNVRGNSKENIYFLGRSSLILSSPLWSSLSMLKPLQAPRRGHHDDLQSLLLALPPSSAKFGQFPGKASSKAANQWKREQGWAWRLWPGMPAVVSSEIVLEYCKEELECIAIAFFTWSHLKKSRVARLSELLHSHCEMLDPVSAPSAAH